MARRSPAVRPFARLTAAGLAAAVLAGPAGAAGAGAATVATGETVLTAAGIGGAVATYEDVVVAGGADAAQVYERDASGWRHTATLTPSPGATGDGFGAAVALTGQFAVVGAPGTDVAGRTDAGAAYVFQRVGAGDWVQRARLVAPAPAAGARFGAAVDASAELWIVVGAPGAGGAWVFEPADPGVTWQVTGALAPPGPAAPDGAGTAVAIEASFGFRLAAVGAPGADGAGAADLYLGSSAGWVHWRRVVEQPRVPGGRFGDTLDLESTGLVVGAPGSASVSGFLVDPAAGAVDPLGREVGGARFGDAVAAGAARAIAGDPAVRAAYLYGRGATGAVLQGTLLPASGAPRDGFGASVAVQQVAVVGAPGAQAVHVFELGTSDVLDRASVTITGRSPYAADGEVYGDVAVRGAGARVLSVVGRGRLVPAAATTTPPPYVAFDLRRVPGTAHVAGSIVIRDATTGALRWLLVASTASRSGPRAATGAGFGLDVTARPPQLVAVRWAVADRAP